jgi:hypothetical protein
MFERRTAMNGKPISPLSIVEFGMGLRSKSKLRQTGKAEGKMSMSLLNVVVDLSHHNTVDIASAKSFFRFNAFFSRALIKDMM